MLKTPAAVLASMCTYLENNDHAQLSNTSRFFASVCRLPQASTVCWRHETDLVPPTHYQPRHVLRRQVSQDTLMWLKTRRCLRTVMLTLDKRDLHYGCLMDIPSCRIYLTVSGDIAHCIPFSGISANLKGFHLCDGWSRPQYTSGLELLRIDGVNVSPYQMASLTRLRELSTHCVAYDDHFGVLEPRVSLSHLTHLEIQSPHPDIVSKSLNALAVNKQLISLTLRYLDAKNMHVLATMTNLRELSFTGHDDLPWEGYSGCPIFPQLTAFRVWSFGTFAVSMLLDLPNVIDLELLCEYNINKLELLCDYGMALPGRRITLNEVLKEPTAKLNHPYFNRIRWRPYKLVGRSWLSDRFDLLTREIGWPFVGCPIDLIC